MKSVLVVKQLTPGRLVVARPPQGVSLRSAGVPGRSGENGSDGLPIELQATGTHLQWRLQGAGDWLDLLALSAIEGKPGDDGDPGQDGKPVELQASATHLQWRLVGDAEWIDLIALSAFKGADGVGVPSGGTVGQVLGKTASSDYATGWIDPPAGGGGGEISTVRIKSPLEFGHGYTVGAANNTSLVTLSPTASRLYLIPFRVPHAMDLLRMAINISSYVVGTNVLLGIYENLAGVDSDLPGALLAGGKVAASASGSVRWPDDAGFTGDTKHVLQPGVIYWAAFASSSTGSILGQPVAAQQSAWGYSGSSTFRCALYLALSTFDLPETLDGVALSYLAGATRPAITMYPKNTQ